MFYRCPHYIMKKILFLILAATMMLAGCQQTSDLQKRAECFEQQLPAVREALRNVGLAVVVVKDNQIVYDNYFGYKNLESEQPLTADCLFRIASISKSFTTTSLLQLMEQGVSLGTDSLETLSLQTDVSKLAGFPIRNPKYPEQVITLEMLLSHTSSICDAEGYFTLNVINPESNPNWANCYRDYAPGEGYEYCNLNLNLAGTFLERLSGERFDQYVVNHVLNPLGLYGGYCVDSLDASRFASLYCEEADWDYTHEEFLAHQIEGWPFVNVDEDAYAPRSERIRNYTFGYDTPVFSPTGGMKLSALDLAKYMMMHMNYGTSPDGIHIISEAMSRQMQTPRSSDENYGLSLWQTDTYSPGFVLTGHTGGAYGMRSAMFFQPEQKFGFVIISNGALENLPDSSQAADPSGSWAGCGNILTATGRLIYECFIL